MGDDYIRTTSHTTVDMEIFMAKIYLKQTGILQKSKSQTEDKRSRVSIIRSRVILAVICHCRFDV